MGGIVAFALKFFTGSTLSFVSKVVTSLANEHAAVVTAQTGLAATEVTAVVSAEIARTNALSSVMQAEMTHRIWWWGWALFVLPAGAYVALIHIKSLACAFLGTACLWNIPEVPKQIEAWDTYIVLSFFGLAATSSILGSIVGRLGKAG
jgi:hypothetical protein